MNIIFYRPLSPATETHRPGTSLGFLPSEWSRAGNVKGRPPLRSSVVSLLGLGPPDGLRGGLRDHVNPEKGDSDTEPWDLQFAL